MGQRLDRRQWFGVLFGLLPSAAAAAALSQRPEKPAPRRLTFVYDATGMLCRVQDGPLTVSTYDARGRLIARGESRQPLQIGGTSY